VSGRSGGKFESQPLCRFIEGLLNLLIDAINCRNRTKPEFRNALQMKVGGIKFPSKSPPLAPVRLRHRHADPVRETR